MRTLMLGLAGLALLIIGSQTVPARSSSKAIEPPAMLVADLTSIPLGATQPGSSDAARLMPEPAAAAVAAPVPIQPPVIAAAPPRKADALLPPFTSAREALVMDEASASVLYAKGLNDRVPPASLTKIATAIVAIEQGNLDRVVTVDVDARDFYDSTLMGLRRGDQFTLRDLLYGLMLKSGNNSAVAIGRAVSGSDVAFVQQMNATAARLGLKNTHFENPHGLDQPGHYSSAYDIAMLARYGMTLPDFRTIVDAEKYTAKGSRTIPMESLISGLLRWVPGSTGIKSGFTDAAGRTLVLSADRNGRRLYAVVMNDQQREQDGSNLIEWGFANHVWGTFVPDTALVAQPPAEDAGVVRAARAGN